jgi:hypothetical protein
MRAVGVVAALFVVSTLSALAASDAAGVGIATCGKFAETYRADPTAAELTYFAWAQGFMTGLNAGLKANNSPRRDIGSMPLDQQKALVRTYCAQHPLEPYVSAILDLTYHLQYWK